VNIWELQNNSRGESRPILKYSGRGQRGLREGAHWDRGKEERERAWLFTIHALGEKKRVEGEEES